MLHEQLMCDVEALSYDFPTQTGTLRMAAGQCCDQTGCIALFVTIDPDVELIETFAGGDRDTTYRRTPSGWQAHLPEFMR